MKTHWVGFFAVASVSLVSAVSCGEGAAPGDSDTTTSTGATTSNAASGGSLGLTSSDDSSDSAIDLTSGLPGGEVDTDGDTPQDLGKNGGTIPLSAEQIESIKSGACSDVTAEARPVPPVIELVVDVSQSMGTAAPGEPILAGRSRWDLARPALLAALDALPDETAVGLQLFPTSSPGVSGTQDCVGATGRVAIAALGPAGSAQRKAIADAMNQTALYLGTPTHDAYHNALEEGLKVYQGPGDKFMLLMTDGAPTQLIGCGELGTSQMAVGLEPILEEVTTTTAGGIRTFVIGSPGSEAGAANDMRPFLSEMAQVGGTGPEGCSNTGPNYCHLDMTQSADFSAALADGLAAIADQVVSTCVFAAPDSMDFDLEDINVIVEAADGSAKLIIEDAEGDCGEGWSWNAAGEIELCPLTCAGLESSPGAVVSVSLGCVELIR